MSFLRHIAGSLSIVCALSLVPASESAANNPPTPMDSSEMHTIDKQWDVIQAEHELVRAQRFDKAEQGGKQYRENEQAERRREEGDKPSNKTMDEWRQESRKNEKKQHESSRTLEERKAQWRDDEKKDQAARGAALKNLENLEKTTKLAKTALDAATTALEYYKALKSDDERMKPNFSPKGAPAVPSQCMEDKNCRPCYEQAQKPLNQARKNLEKVRAISEYTNGFTKKGQAFLNSLGAAGPGGLAGIQATYEVQKAETELKKFNDIVKKKNKELLTKVEASLHEISSCEARFYKNDDWYNRYGFIYYQFMLARYETY